VIEETCALTSLSSLAEVGIGVNLAFGLIRDVREGLFRRRQRDIERTVVRLTDQVQETADKLELAAPLDLKSTLEPVMEIEKVLAKIGSAVDVAFKSIATACAVLLAAGLWLAPWFGHVKLSSFACSSIAAALAFGPLALASLVLFLAYSVGVSRLEKKEETISGVLARLKVVPTTPVPPP
jgi:hypothetical protein